MKNLIFLLSTLCLATSLLVSCGNDDNGDEIIIPENTLDELTQLGQDILGEESFQLAEAEVELSADGRTMIIGAPERFTETDLSGFARVYRLNGTIWEQLGNDIGGDNGTYYNVGEAVSISDDGNIIAVNSAVRTSDTRSHLRIFKFNNETWEQVGDDIIGEPNGQSGRAGLTSLNEDGTVVAFVDSAIGDISDEVIVYQFNGSTWLQQGDPIASVPAGIKLSKDGSTLAIGGISGASVYTYTNQNWILKGQQLNSESNAIFIVGLSSDNNTIVIGSIVYEFINNEWVQKGSELDISLARAGAISDDGKYAVIANDFGGDNSNGEVGLFKYENDSWVLIGDTILGETSEKLGRSLDISSDGKTIAIYAPGNSTNGDNSGLVRVYTINGDLLSL